MKLWNISIKSTKLIQLEYGSALRITKQISVLFISIFWRNTTRKLCWCYIFQHCHSVSKLRWNLNVFNIKLETQCNALCKAPVEPRLGAEFGGWAPASDDWMLVVFVWGREETVWDGARAVCWEFAGYFTHTNLDLHSTCKCIFWIGICGVSCWARTTFRSKQILIDMVYLFVSGLSSTF